MLTHASPAVVFSTLSGLVGVAQAGQHIEVADAPAITPALESAIAAALKKQDARQLISTQLKLFGDVLRERGVPVDTSLLLAVNQDSTTNATQCYNNCYSNCHGSRGWR